MGPTLTSVEAFLRDRGMHLNPKKCVAISAATFQGKSVPRTKGIFRIGGQFIPSIKDLSTFRYLGLQFRATGAAKPTLFNVTNWLRNLEKSPLKPQQKYLLLRDHLVLRLLYGFQSPTITAQTLTECDRLIRRTTKRILHLPKTTGNQFLHATGRDGGLGISNLRYKVPAIIEKRISCLQATDSLFAAVVESEPGKSTVERLKRLAPSGNPDAYWREQLATRPLSTGLQDTIENVASRKWLNIIPIGWIS